MGSEYAQIKNVKMLVLDVDGVLTDCRIWLDANGEWKRMYSIRDGVGIKRLIEAGYKVAVITGTKAEDIRARVKVLGMHYLFEGHTDKMPAFLDLQKQSGIGAKEMAYIGDDYFDIPLLREVAFSATVPEAVDEVMEVAGYITKRPGGNGAVREVCDLIFKHGAFSPSAGRL